MTKEDIEAQKAKAKHSQRKICSNCEWFRDHDWGDPQITHHNGECFHGPPVFLGDWSSGIPIFGLPVVERNGTCSFFKRRDSKDEC